MDKAESDEQTTNASVAVDEGMDRFELGMGQPDVNQHREIHLVVEEALEVIQGRVHVQDRRWDEQGSLDRGVFGADPVLIAAKLPGRSVRASPGPE